MRECATVILIGIHMYNKYYALQLYKKGYLRVKDQNNKKRLTEIVDLANSYRTKRGYPANLALENVNHFPIHRKSIQELKNDLASCIKHKVTAEDCITSTGHPDDAKWILENARKKLPSRKSLVKHHINILKQPVFHRKATTRKVTRRSSIPYMSFLKEETRDSKSSS
jgi:hypothetical protein